MEQSYIEVVPVSVEEAAKKFNEEFGQSYNIYRCDHSDSIIYVWHNTYKKQFILDKEVKHTEYMGYPVFYYETKNSISVAPTITNAYSIIIPKDKITIKVNSPEYNFIRSALQEHLDMIHLKHPKSLKLVIDKFEHISNIAKAFKINMEN